MKYLLSAFIAVFISIALSSCKEGANQAGFSPAKADYMPLLKSPIMDPIAENNSLIDFWSARMTPDSTGVGELAPLGGAYEERFQLKGVVGDLHHAMRLYQLGVMHSAHHKDQYVRHQARVAISLHEFDLGYRLLDSLLSNGGQNRQTRLQFFDAAMEVGRFEIADSLLSALEDDRDFNYLIRAAKWNDHRGDLDTAILFMEKAMHQAEARDSAPLLQWVYSNLATFYGHAGRLEESYQLLLKTLRLNPRHVQSLKQLCWLQYSSAGNIAAALEIIAYLESDYQGLDLILLKAEILEFKGDFLESTALQKKFILKVKERHINNLYVNNIIEIELEQSADGVAVARKQFELRPTAQQAALLAYGLYRSGEEVEAEELIAAWDLQNANEPMARYYAMKTLHAMGIRLEKTAWQELADSHFELGPLRAAEVKGW